MKTSLRASRAKRGSALIVALLLTIGIAVMLASYHSLIHFNLRSSHRSYHSSAAMNLAETGLEEAIWSINQQRAKKGGAYAQWDVVGDTATREFVDKFSVGTASSTYVKVRITNCNLTLAAPPTVKAEARISLSNGLPPVTKWVEITLNAASTGVPLQPRADHRGLVAKETIIFSGNNGTVDSWNSDPNQVGAQTQPYDPSKPEVVNDRAFVGSIQLALDTVTVSNADIKGFVATATDDIRAISDNVGPQGSILGEDSPAGTRIDTNRIATDFTTDLRDVVLPTTTTSILPTNKDAVVTIIYKDLGLVGDSISLPRSVDTPADDGKYYYKTSGIDLRNKAVKITSDKVIISTPSPYNISIGGNSGAITIANGASLEIYAGRDVSISGQGISNGTPATSGPSAGAMTASTVQQPAMFKLWGTGAKDATPQIIKIAGNGALSGVVYAPNGNVTINGNGDVMGSVVAKNISLVGNAQFHYDEALGQQAFGTGADSGSTALVLDRWRELLSAAETTW
jgi:Tfp pilus assembly protein PilX